MRPSASELSIGYRNHPVDSGIDVALTAAQVLVLLTAQKRLLLCDIAWLGKVARP